MKIETPHNEAVLRPDFARRVIERVRRAKRRRRLGRWALTSAIACALPVVAILYLRPGNVPTPFSTLVPSRDESHSEWIVPAMERSGTPESDSPSFGQPLAFFFPGASVVADFQSSEATYWHSYDPWWNPNP